MILSLVGDFLPALIRHHAARMCAFAAGCVFVTVWFYGHVPRRFDGGRELHARRLRAAYYEYRCAAQP